MLNSFKRYFINRRNKLIASSKFQKWAGNTPILRSFARRDGEKIYDLMAGFVYSQTLLAMVELNIFVYLETGDLSVGELSNKTKIPENRILLLCQSATAINLLERSRSGYYCLSRLGAAIVGIPGLTDMIRHHKLFYQDLLDPVGLLKNQVNTNMSKYWPYVLNNSKQMSISKEVAGMYSNLMHSSQKLVAEETLRLVSFSRTKALLDIGGGTGAFIREVAKVAPEISFGLFDLPQVVEEAKQFEFMSKSLNKISFFGGSFLTDSFPSGFDTVALIRVLYDHDDEVVFALLKKVYNALPNNGRIIISEPMSGGQKPTRPGDSYFGFYTMAMTTGRPRSAEMHEENLYEAGFTNIKKYKGTREFITKLMTAEKKL